MGTETAGRNFTMEVNMSTEGPFDVMFSDDTVIDMIKDSLLKHMTPFTIVLMVLYSFSFLVGLVGNVMVITAVMRIPTMRTLTNTMFVNLAVADLMVILVCMPFTLARYVYQNWIYGEVMCRITPFVQGASVSVSVLTLLAVSVDRYLAVHKPMKARLIFSHRKVVLMLCAIWVISLLLFVPFLFVNQTTSTKVEGVFEIISCQEKWPDPTSRRVYSLTLFIVLYILPVAFMFVTYFQIGKILWTDNNIIRRHSVGSGGPSAKNDVRQKRQKVVKMLGFLVLLFGVSWLPYHIINLWMEFTFDSKYKDSDDIVFVANYLFPIVQWFGLANSTTNPLCYCLFSKMFRQAFRATCACCTRRRRYMRGEDIATDGWDTWTDGAASTVMHFIFSTQSAIGKTFNDIRNRRRSTQLISATELASLNLDKNANPQ